MKNVSKKIKIDVMSEDKYKSKNWLYGKIVKEHFFNPRNILLDDDYKVDGIGPPAALPAEI